MLNLIEIYEILLNSIKLSILPGYEKPGCAFQLSVAGLEASSQKFSEYIQNGCLKEAKTIQNTLWGLRSGPKSVVC